MPRFHASSSNGANGRLFLLLLLAAAAAAAAATGVQAFVPASSSQHQHQQRPMTTTMAARRTGGGLDSRRGSLQRTGAWGFAGAAAAGLLSASSPSISPALAAAAGGDPREALKRVIVVRDSTAQLRDDLENGTGAADPDVRALVTSLLRNYQLKDSMDAALALGAFGGSAAKDGAVAHAKAAVEDLSIVLEYFPEAQAGPIAGKIRLRPEELAFTLKALTAAGKELSDYLTSFPPDMVKQLMEEIYKA